MVMKTFRSLLLVFAASAFAGGLRAQTDSGGGWKQDMQTEFAAWRATPVAIDLAHFRDELPLGVRIDLALRPNAELKFLVAPRRAPAPDSFGGMPAFQVPQDGLYRVSAGASVWIDVVETVTGQNIQAQSFEEQAKSDLHKCVVFPLRTRGALHAADFGFEDRGGQRSHHSGAGPEELSARCLNGAGLSQALKTHLATAESVRMWVVVSGLCRRAGGAAPSRALIKPKI